MVESQGMEGMKVAWKMENTEGLDYKPQLFVVNIVGARFSSKVDSDIRWLS